MLDEEECDLAVDIEHIVVFFLGDIEDGFLQHLSSGVDSDSDLALALSSRKECCDLIDLGQVRLETGIGNLFDSSLGLVFRRS